MVVVSSKEVVALAIPTSSLKGKTLESGLVPERCRSCNLWFLAEHLGNAEDAAATNLMASLIISSKEVAALVKAPSNLGQKEA